MIELIIRIENAIDTSERLTRRSATSTFMCEAQIVCMRDGFRAECKVRGKSARGRGAKTMHSVGAHGATAAEAVEKLIDELPVWAEVLSK